MIKPWIFVTTSVVCVLAGVGMGKILTHRDCLNLSDLSSRTVSETRVNEVIGLVQSAISALNAQIRIRSETRS